MLDPFLCASVGEDHLLDVEGVLHPADAGDLDQKGDGHEGEGGDLWRQECPGEALGHLVKVHLTAIGVGGHSSSGSNGHAFKTLSPPERGAVIEPTLARPVKEGTADGTEVGEHQVQGQGSDEPVHGPPGAVGLVVGVLEEPVELHEEDGEDERQPGKEVDQDTHYDALGVGLHGDLVEVSIVDIAVQQGEREGQCKRHVVLCRYKDRIECVEAHEESEVNHRRSGVDSVGRHRVDGHVDAAHPAVRVLEPVR